MNTIPKKMTIGTNFSLIGGIIALIYAFVLWNIDVYYVAQIGLDMLVGLMFFGVAGCFTKYTPVPGSTAFVLSAICEALIFIAIMCGSLDLFIGIVLAAFGIMNVIFASSPKVILWIDHKRSI